MSISIAIEHMNRERENCLGQAEKNPNSLCLCKHFPFFFLWADLIQNIVIFCDQIVITYKYLIIWQTSRIHKEKSIDNKRLIS